MSTVELMWVTPNAEFMIAKMARGSNPPNQDNPEFRKLFQYCIKHGHWSPFQMASMCVQVRTSLAIAGQVKRHWSISCCEPADIQETSMRYMDPFDHDWGFQEVEFRRAADSNRQSSEEPLTGNTKQAAEDALYTFMQTLDWVHKELKSLGVANETLRMVYPQMTTTQFYLSGSCRSWLHYFEQRLSEHAQMEHQLLALDLWDIFVECFPIISSITLLKGESSVVAQTKHVNEKLKSQA